MVLAVLCMPLPLAFTPQPPELRLVLALEHTVWGGAAIAGERVQSRI